MTDVIISFIGGLTIAGMWIIVAYAKIKCLKNELTQKQQHLDKIREELKKSNEVLDDMLKFRESTPSNCKRGEWCKLCGFAKYYHKYSRYTLYCGKEDLCPSFIDKFNHK